jgi:glucokinase
MDLIADIGATNSRCALLDQSGRIGRTENYLNSDFDDLDALLGRFIAGANPERAALAVAAPIAGDEVVMTNVDWRFSQRSLTKTLGLRELSVYNDFEALAHALPYIGEADCHQIGGGTAAPGQALAVLGPGSGLGVAAIVPHGNGWTAVAGEGGHVTLPVLSEAEARVVADHGDPNGHCSAERLLSGPGLVRIYSSLARGSSAGNADLTPAEITEAALRGDETAKQTYDVFFSLLGTVAGNLALTVGARSGVYVGGGIVPRVIGLIEASEFRERFVAKGRYRTYLDAIPTCIITAAQPAFLGLRALLGFG